MIDWNKINGGFLAPDYIPFEERNKNEMINELKCEVNQLNNIINELENWLASSLTNEEFCYLAENYKDRCRYDVYNEVLDKLKELKESSNNE